MGSPVGFGSEVGNPLAELARVAGQDDPFRNLFRDGRATQRPSVEPVLDFARVAEPYAENEAVDVHTERHHDAYAGAQETADDLELRPSTHDAPDWDWAKPEADHQWDPRQDASGDAHQPAHEEYEEHPEALPVSAPHYVAPPMTPDLWAEQAEEAESGHIEPSAPEDAPDDPTSSRRPLIVLMAVLALTGGGLAATFLARTSPGVAGREGSAPTIMAATSPTKVKQADGTTDATTVDADAALLSTKVGNGGPVKVVNSQEQPIDLAQLPKSSGAATASSPFPEPKKVKTFLVRPDGSLVNPASAPQQPSRSTVPQFAVGAGGDAAAPAPAAPTPAARPSTPKTGTHSSATPKTPPATIADIAADDGNAAVQPASAGARPSTSKPVEMADASPPDATASTGSGGSFALQLAASPNEQDARSAFTKLQKKHSELGGFQPTVKKVENGQKTVYRLRVGNLSQDHAKTLCSQLQASGGSCFVVHN